MAITTHPPPRASAVSPTEVAIDAALPPRTLTAKRLRRMLESSEMLPGDRLPSERKIAEQFSVDRGTVRSAFQRLQDEGWITTGPRGERYVAQTRDDPGGIMTDSIVMIGNYVAPAMQAGHQAPGWAETMALGCHRSILDKGLYALSFTLGVDHEQKIDRLLQQPPKGVVLAEAAGHRDQIKQLAQRLRAAGVPIVAYGDDADLAPHDRVVSDHRAGAAMLTRWLIDQGRRRILMIAPPQHDAYWARQRHAGYTQALGEAGLTPLDPLQIPAVDAKEATYEKRFEILSHLIAAYLLPYLNADEPIDAILCPSDGDTFPVAAACRLLGKQPQRDVSIVGYDNYYTDSPEQRFEPTLPAATIDKRNDRLGSSLVDLLLERLDTPDDAEPIRRLIEPELILTQAADRDGPGRPSETAPTPPTQLHPGGDP